MSGSNVLVGATGVNSGQGAAYLFDTSGQLLETFADPSAKPLDDFGTSVALSGSNVLVGAVGVDSFQGAAYLFSTSGQLLQTFVDPSAGGGYFGSSVALTGSEVLVGAQGDYDFQGAAYLFIDSGQVVQTFLDPNAVGGDNFGHAVAASTDQSGTSIVVGAFGVDMNQGAAYLYLDPVIKKSVPGALDATVGTNFADRLAVSVQDASGSALAGVPVTFIVNTGATSVGPKGGAGATLPDGKSAVTVETNSAGQAIAPVLTANDMAGSYTVTATLGNTSTSFILTNTAVAPANVTVFGGGLQDAPDGEEYAHRFQVLVTDRFGNPVAGVPVSFAVPEFGATGTFSAGPDASTNVPGVGLAPGEVTPLIIADLVGARVPTNVLGIATAPMFTANHTPGKFKVTATVPGVSTAANFNLTNTAVPAAIKVFAGSGQKTRVNTPFPQPLEALVTDAEGKPVSGITVDFEAPAMGPSGTFTAPAQVVTDSNGVAIAPIFVANAVPGKYTVTAWVVDVTVPAMFTLTNSSKAAALAAKVGGGSMAGRFSLIHKPVPHGPMAGRFRSAIPNWRSHARARPTCYATRRTMVAMTREARYGVPGTPGLSSWNSR
jgi:hypothetical protein